MSVVNYKDARDYVVDYLKDKFPAQLQITVAAHPGQFDADEIKRVAQKERSILTSFMGTRHGDGDNQDMEFVTWVMWRATNKDPLADHALVVISALVPLLRELDAQWSHGGADKIEAKNLYSGSLGAINVALWAIYWRWPIRGNIAVSVDDILNGGILLPDDLENFEGADSQTKVGTDTVESTVDVEQE